MAALLESRNFSEAELYHVQGFHCGEQPWAKAAAAWIAGGPTERSALWSMATHGTQVWLYFVDAEELVGFSAIGKTRWPEHEQPQGLIVQMAILSRFQGKPLGENQIKFSHQILDDVIGRGKLFDADWLLLTVAPANAPARKLYSKFGFVEFGGMSPRGDIKMQLRLR